MDIFEAGEEAMMQRIPMLRDDAGKGGGGRRNEPKNVLGDRLGVCSLSQEMPRIIECSDRNPLILRNFLFILKLSLSCRNRAQFPLKNHFIGAIFLGKF
jgi:hypothetical protein